MFHIIMVKHVIFRLICYTLPNDGEGGDSISGNSCSVLRCILKQQHSTLSHFDFNAYFKLAKNNPLAMLTNDIQKVSFSIYNIMRLYPCIHGLYL